MVVFLVSGALLFSLLRSSSLAFNGHTFNEDRVINGLETTLSEFPSVVRYQSSSMICTATIISKRHVLTASHCTHGSNRHCIEFKNLPPNEWDQTCAGTVHSKNQFVEDIAILEFPEDTDLLLASRIKPIPLAKDYAEQDQDNGIAVGYGIHIWNYTDNFPVNRVPSISYYANIPIHLSKSGSVTGPYIYTGYLNNRQNDLRGKNLTDEEIKILTKKNIEAGDSGGPLFFEGADLYQIGITKGSGMSYDILHGVFTRMSLHCDWIENVTKSEVKCVPLLRSNSGSPLTTDIPVHPLTEEVPMKKLEDHTRSSGDVPYDSNSDISTTFSKLVTLWLISLMIAFIM